MICMFISNSFLLHYNQLIFSRFGMQGSSFQHSAHTFKYPDSLSSLKKNSQYTGAFLKVFQDRINLQNNYVSGLRKLVNELELEKILLPVDYSDFLYNHLVESIEKEAQRFEQFIKSIQNQLMPVLDNKVKQQDIFYREEVVKLEEMKNVIITRQKITKTSLDNYMNKYRELKALEESYVRSAINKQGFENKNKAWLDADSKKKNNVDPLKVIYEKNAEKLGLTMKQYGQKNQSVFQILQNIEGETKKDLQFSLIKYSDIYCKYLIGNQRQNKNSNDSLKNKSEQFENQNKKEIQILENRVPTGHDLFYIEALFNYASKDNSGNLLYLMNLGKVGRDSLPSGISVSSTSNQSRMPRGKIGKSDEQIVHKIVEYMKKVFMMQTLHNQDRQVNQLSQILNGSAERRKIALMCMQGMNFNDNQGVPFANIPRIKKFLGKFLTQCINEFDIHNSKHLLWFSVTTQVIQSDNQNQKLTYLAKYIKKHRIWQALEWWECTFLQYCYESLILTAQPSKSETDNITIWDIKGVGVSKNILEMTPAMRMFSYLESLTNQMESLDIPKEVIEKLIPKYIREFELKSIFDSCPQTIIRKYYIPDNIDHAHHEGPKGNWLKNFFH